MVGTVSKGPGATDGRGTSYPPERIIDRYRGYFSCMCIFFFEILGEIIAVVEL